METVDGGEPRAQTLDERKAVRRMVQTQGVARADVEDVTQEVLLALARHREGFSAAEGRTVADAWRGFMWGVVQRQVAAYRRVHVQRRLGEAGTTLAGEQVVPSSEEVILAGARATVLRAALGELEQQEPALHEVIMCYLDGLPVAGVAAALEIPVNTVWTRLSRARVAVRATVQRWAVEEASRRICAGLVRELRR